MLLLIAVLAILSAAFLFWAKGRRARSEITSSVDQHRIDNTRLRPLFEPSQDDLDNEARAVEARQIDAREDAKRAQADARIVDALDRWRSSPSVSSAADALTLISEDGNGEKFSQAADEMMAYYRATDFQALSAASLADLIDSHIRLLPVSERGSGTLFWLKEEISRLRSASGVGAAQKHS